MKDRQFVKSLSKQSSVFASSLYAPCTCPVCSHTGVYVCTTGSRGGQVRRHDDNDNDDNDDM